MTPPPPRAWLTHGDDTSFHRNGMFHENFALIALRVPEGEGSVLSGADLQLV